MTYNLLYFTAWGFTPAILLAFYLKASSDVVYGLAVAMELLFGVAGVVGNEITKGVPGFVLTGVFVFLWLRYRMKAVATGKRRKVVHDDDTMHVSLGELMHLRKDEEDNNGQW